MSVTWDRRSSYFLPISSYYSPNSTKELALQESNNEIIVTEKCCLHSGHAPKGLTLILNSGVYFFCLGLGGWEMLNLLKTLIRDTCRQGRGTSWEEKAVEGGWKRCEIGTEETVLCSWTVTLWYRAEVPLLQQYTVWMHPVTIEKSLS